MLSSFREIWVVDFEYTPIPGGRPIPLCVVAREIRSGRLVRLRKDEFGPLPPYPTDKSVCFVAYFASAELTCHAVLGWPMPERVLDLYVEFRERFNGLKTVAGNGMLGACAQFGIPHISEEAKKKGRGLAIRGGHFTPSEKAYLVEYCLSDVDAEVKLMDVMLPGIDIPRAIGIRGRYMPAVARIQHAGVPIHVGRSTRLVTPGRTSRRNSLPTWTPATVCTGKTAFST